MERDTIYDELINNASEISPVVKIAAEHIRNRTEHMRNDMSALLNKLYEYYYTDCVDLSGAALRDKVVKYIDAELVAVEALERACADSVLAKILPYQIKVNKMLFALTESRKRFADDEDLDATLEMLVSLHTYDERYTGFDAVYPMLRTNTYWGCNAGITDITGLFCLRFATSDDILLNYATSSIAHVTVHPDLPLDLYRNPSRFLTMTPEWKPAFAFIHTGYALGGQRQEKVQYEFGPEDCSSFVAKVMTAAVSKTPYAATPCFQFSTIDQEAAWRTICDPTFASPVYGKEAAAYFGRHIAPVLLSSESVQPGDIYVSRNFACSKMRDAGYLGSTGHTGIVVARDPVKPGNFVVLNDARDLESENRVARVYGMAGMGVSSFSGADEKISRCFFSESGEEICHSISSKLFLRPAVGC